MLTSAVTSLDQIEARPEKAARFMNSSQSESGRRLLFFSSHICTWFQEQLSADQIKHDRQDNKWNQPEQIGMRPFKEGIVMRGPIFPAFELVHDSFFEIQESKHDAGECSTRNVTRGHQYAGTLVGFSNHLLFTQLLMFGFLPKILVHHPADYAPYENWSRRRDGKVNAHRKSQ